MTLLANLASLYKRPLFFRILIYTLLGASGFLIYLFLTLGSIPLLIVESDIRSDPQMTQTYKLMVLFIITIGVILGPIVGFLWEQDKKMESILTETRKFDPRDLNPDYAASGMSFEEYQKL